ncbi:MAG: flagellar biosynthetic protein FliO [Armatimonadota bacterium]
MRTCTLALTLVLAVALAVGPAPAQEGSVERPGPPSDEGGYLADPATQSASLSVVDVVGKLMLALVVAWGVIRGIRWWQHSRLNSLGEGGRGGRRMWLEETLSLGADGRLYLVEVEGRRILLAARDGSVVEIADVTGEPTGPSAYHAVRRRADGSTDELNVARAGISTRSVRPDVVEGGDESWERRRGRLLRELQEQG